MPLVQFTLIVYTLLGAHAFLQLPKPAHQQLHGAKSLAPYLPERAAARAKALDRSGSVRMAGMDKLRELDALLRAHDSPQRCLDLLKKLDESAIKLDQNRAAELLSQVGNAVLMSVDGETLDGNLSTSTTAGSLSERDLSYLYDELHKRGLLRAYGSVQMDVVPYTNKNMTPEKLEELTGLRIKALAPGKSDNAWAYAGVALCVAEAGAAQYYGVDPLQVVIPATIGVFALDRIVFRGAVFESIARFVNPAYKEKIVRHEAGHFLLAYLLGCPVTGCLLDPWEVQKYVRGGQGGTVFADPIFARGIESGSLTKSAVDRFSIILMAGIAAEAGQFGKADGGGVDESTLIDILSSIQPPFTFEMIRRQARWAATQAVLLIKEHQSAYDALVDAIEGGASLGTCIMAIETALEKQRLQQPSSPTPTEARRQALAISKGVSQDSESMRLRRMLEKQFQRNDVRTNVESNIQVPDDLAQRLKQMQLLSTGSSAEVASADQDISPAVVDGDGVWLRGTGNSNAQLDNDATTVTTSTANSSTDVAASATSGDSSTSVSTSINSMKAQAAKAKQLSDDLQAKEMARIEARLQEVNTRLQEMTQQQSHYVKQQQQHPNHSHAGQAPS